MIKLERAPKPSALTEEKAEELTEKFIKDGTSVWNVDFIKKPLLESSHSKCAYCETRLNEESKYMEVEHFKDKKDFPQDVVAWENLLPSCKKCNGNKSSHNVVEHGAILNPYDNHPKDHIFLKNYRIFWRDDIGRRTIDVVYLNDTERLVQVRFELGDEISASLETIRDRVEDYIGGNKTTRMRNKIRYGMRNLLLEAQPTAQFSSVSATILLSNSNYLWIKSQLEELDLWKEFNELDEAAASLSLAE